MTKIGLSLAPHDPEHGRIDFGKGKNNEGKSKMMLGLTEVALLYREMGGKK